VRRFNEAIYRDLGIDNLICVIAEPTLESANALFAHRNINLICVTGGPAVARAALNSGKRAVVAGPGNPPVVVDETADLDRAARSIIRGAPTTTTCCASPRKEVFVVERLRPDDEAMERAGAVRLSSREVDQLTKNAIVQVGEGEHKHDAPARTSSGRTRRAGPRGRQKRRLRPTKSSCCSARPTTSQPVRPRRADDAVRAVRPLPQRRRGDRPRRKRLRARLPPHEHHPLEQREEHDPHGPDPRHDLFVKNGPCMASLGLGGEGYLSFSIAGPTGEGVTTPLTFTRERRCSLIDDLCILGKPAVRDELKRRNVELVRQKA
jgi:aldehyde dehydrogenase